MDETFYSKAKSLLETSDLDSKVADLPAEKSKRLAAEYVCSEWSYLASDLFKLNGDCEFLKNLKKMNVEDSPGVREIIVKVKSKIELYEAHHKPLFCELGLDTTIFDQSIEEIRDRVENLYPGRLEEI